MKKVALWCFAVMAFGVTVQDSKQLIVVQSQHWDDPKAQLVRYEKIHGKWVQISKPIKVHIGRGGMGWGIGLHALKRGAYPMKREGDGKSPAGIFELKQAFGYAPLKGVRHPYRVYKRSDHCVDDSASVYYNKIVDSTRIKPDYRSFEHMKFDKNYYKYGIVVNHNHIDEAGAIPQRGSCIFLHIKTVPTAGCTVMDEAQIVQIIRWLDPAKHPIILQAPKSVLPFLWEQVR